MNSKQRRQQKRRATRTADYFAGLMLELAQQARNEDWDREKLLAELEESGTMLKTVLLEIQEGRA